MRMIGPVAIAATCCVLAVSTPVSAQIGEFLKVLKNAAEKASQKTDADPKSELNTPSLAGRWIPAGESCAGIKGVSERMIEFKGKEMNAAFASCEFPTAIASRSSFNGTMSCSDEEGGETLKTVSTAIQQDGTMVWREREGSGPIRQGVYKKCSSAPRFPSEDPPAPLKPISATRSSANKSPAKPKVACSAGETALAIGTYRDNGTMENMAGVAFCQGPAKTYYSIRTFSLDGSIHEFQSPRDGKINFEAQELLLEADYMEGLKYPGSLYILSYKDGNPTALIIPSYAGSDYRDARNNTVIYTFWETPYLTGNDEWSLTFNLGRRGLDDFLAPWTQFESDLETGKITKFFTRLKTKNNYKKVMNNHNLPTE